MTPSKALTAVSLGLGFVFGSLAEAGEPPVTQLTFQGGTAPAWSPDGTQIAFTSQRSGHREIWIMPATGEPATQLTNFPIPGAWDAAWSPDGTAIAFTRDLGPLVGNDIWVMPAAGGNAVQLSQHNEDDVTAAWSGDGMEILFSTSRGIDIGHDIWVMPAAGEPPATPVAEEGSNTYPDCTRDGSQIAFASNRSGAIEIWVMPKSGGQATQVTFDENAENPSWSPDGTQIAFTGAGGIWVTFAGRGKATQITFDDSDFNPDWSPDGTHIAFTSSRSGTVNIWVVALETAGIGSVAAPPASLKLAVSPNPFSDATRIQLPDLPGTAALRVIDIAGRVVRELGLPTGGSVDGERVVVWDGRDDGGRAVPRGVYYFMLDAGNSRVSERVIRLR